MSADAVNEGDKDEAIVTGIRLHGDFKYKLAPISEIVTDASLRMYWGRIQARYDDDLYQSHFKVNEAYINLKPDGPFEARIGAHSQSALKSNLIVAPRRSFAGVKEILKWENRTQTVTLWAQQTIPSSYSMNSRRSEREKTPTFLTESLDWEVRPNEEWNLNLFTTHYRYNNLPSLVAYESSVLGNFNTDGTTPNNTSFVTEFDGILIGTEACWCGIQKVGLVGGYQFLRNFGDKGNLNQAQDVSLGVKIKTADFDFEPVARVFAVEGNVAPASYSHLDYGYTNRQGVNFEVVLTLNKYGFSIKGEYSQSEPIVANASQGSFRGGFIGVESRHVEF